MQAAPTASPSFPGTPLVPTATQGTNTTQIATTAFVNARNLSTQFGEWALNNYSLPMTSTTPLIPTLITPTVYAGSWFSTNGFTVPTGQGGLYLFEVYGEIVNSGNNLVVATIGLRLNTINFVKRSQLNTSAVVSAYIQTVTGLIFLNAGDNIRPVLNTSFSTGTTNLNSLSFMVHKMPSY